VPIRSVGFPTALAASWWPSRKGSLVRERPPGGGGRVVKTHSALRRTEPSVRGVAPDPAPVARSATGGRTAERQGVTFPVDEWQGPCESREPQTVNRTPTSISHARTPRVEAPGLGKRAPSRQPAWNRGSVPWTMRPSTSTPSSRIGFRRTRIPASALVGTKGLERGGSAPLRSLPNQRNGQGCGGSPGGAPGQPKLCLGGTGGSPEQEVTRR